MSDGKIEAPVPLSYTRKQVYKFMSLPYHIRLQMAKDLYLLEAGENGLDSQDLNMLIVKRVSERGPQGVQGLWRRVDLEDEMLQRYRARQ